MAKGEKKSYRKYLDTFCYICNLGKENPAEASRKLVCHHIIFQSEFKKLGKRVDHSKKNIACVCANCHSDIHAGIIIIEGYLASTKGRVLKWKRDGEDWKFNFLN